MLDFLPAILNSFDEFRAQVRNNISFYYEHYPSFAKFIIPVLEGVLNSNFPIDLLLLRDIYLKRSFKALNAKLVELEGIVGQDVLMDVFAEIDVTSADDFLIRFQGALAELDSIQYVCQLRDIDTTTVQKIHSQGDFSFHYHERFWNLEVKNLADEDLSLNCIEHALHGAMWLKANRPLREHCNITLSQNGVNHRFRKEVIAFIHAELASEIAQSVQPNSPNEFVYSKTIQREIYNRKQKARASMIVEIERYLDEPESPVIVSFNYRVQEESEVRQCSIELHKEDLMDEKQPVSVSYNNAFWIGAQYLEWETLSEKMNRVIRPSDREAVMSRHLRV